MKKLIVMLALVALPASAADWKTKTVDHIIQNGGKFIAAIDPTLAQENNKVAASYGAVTGICFSMIAGAGDTTALSEMIDLLTFDEKAVTSLNGVRKTGKQCFTRLEEIYLKQGMSKKEVEKLVVSQAREMVKHLTNLQTELQ